MPCYASVVGLASVVALCGTPFSLSAVVSPTDTVTLLRRLPCSVVIIGDNVETKRRTLGDKQREAREVVACLGAVLLVRIISPLLSTVVWVVSADKVRNRQRLVAVTVLPSPA